MRVTQFCLQVHFQLCLPGPPLELVPLLEAAQPSVGVGAAIFAWRRVPRRIETRVATLPFPKHRSLGKLSSAAV